MQGDEGVKRLYGNFVYYAQEFQMNNEQIMTQIASGITGNYAQDARHLMAQYKVYENHEDSRKISNTIRVLMYNLIPNDDAFALKKSINEKNDIKNILLKIEPLLKANKFAETSQMMTLFINELENISKWFTDDDINEFHNFDALFEEQIYIEIFKPIKKVRQMPWHFAIAYQKYAAILFELKQYDKAKLFFEKANKINPTNTSIMFDIGEIHKINKNWDEYLKITAKCLQYAYSTKEIARCYRNYGYYFIEQQDYDAAIALYHFSLLFDLDKEANIAFSELQHIAQATGKNLENITKADSIDEKAKQFQKHNIQLGANKAILILAFTLMIKSVAGAKEILYDIGPRYKKLYDFSGDKEINFMLSSISGT